MSTRIGSRVVSPAPQTNRGRTTTVSSPAPLASITAASAAALVAEYGAREPNASGACSSTATSGWPCISAASVPTWTSRFDARGAAGRDDGLGAVHVDAAELLPGPEVAEPGGRVERDVGAARAALERARVEQVAAHGLRPGLAHLRLGLGRARERADRPAVGGEAADQGGPDEAGAAGHERGGHGRPRYCGAMSAIPEPAQRLAPQARWAWRLSWAGTCVVALIVLGDGRRRRCPGRGRPSGWRRSASRCWSGTPLVPELRWRRWRWEVREHEIDLQRGILVVRRTLIPMARVQHVETERGVIGQLLGLSTVEIHTAAGSHEIPLLRDGDAGAIRSRIAELARTDADERRRAGADRGRRACPHRRWVAACTRPRSRSTPPTRCARARSRCSCCSACRCSAAASTPRRRCAA